MEHSMRNTVLASLLLAAFAASPAYADGALAVGVSEGGPKNGYAYTMNVRNGSADSAEKAAVEGCRTQAVEYGVQPNLCRVVASFRGRCVSVAFDTVERAAGWALGDKKDDAIANAVKKCAEGGAKQCKPHNVECDY
jgi:hypothetical protein